MGTSHDTAKQKCTCVHCKKCNRLGAHNSLLVTLLGWGKVLLLRDGEALLILLDDDSNLLSSLSLQLESKGPVT